MNIAFFTDTYHPYVSGVANSIDLFKNELEKEGHRVFIFAPLLKDKNGKIPKDPERVYRIESMKQNMFSEFTMTLPNLPPIFRDFKKFKIDIVHSHTPFYMGMYASLVAVFYNLPVVHTYHTLYEKYTGHSMFKRWYKADKAVMSLAKDISVFYSRRCDQLIAPSEKLKGILQSYGIKNDIAVIPTGIILDKFKNVDKEWFRHKYDIGLDKKVLLYLGRVAPPKNPLFLDDILERVVKKRDDVVLAIVGSGPSEEDLKKEFEKKGVANKVVWAGQVSKERVPYCNAGSDVFVFPSLTDTQSLVILEAAASGLPVVMLKDEGLTPVVKDLENGFEIPNEDADLFAEKVDLLLQDRFLYDKMSDKSKENASQFSIQNQARKLLELYGTTVEKHEESSWRKRMLRGLRKEINLRDFFMEDGKLKILNKIKELRKKLKNGN